MTAATTFSLTRNGEPLLEIALTSGCMSSESRVDVNELQAYGFQVDQREPDTEYSLWLGDVEAGRTMRMDHSPASTIGFARGRSVLWDDAPYFDGARGPVSVRLRSRPLDKDETWQDRLILSVVVAAGKLSSDRYATMFAQMSRLAAGLVLDLVSKSTRSIRATLSTPVATVRTSAIELQILEAIWPTVAEDLYRIAQAPESLLRRRFVVQNCWGSERLDSRSLVTLARNGSDPLGRGAPVPFRTQVHRIEESLDTTEHRTIRAFLELLGQRAGECEANVLSHMDAIRRDRQWRDRPSHQGTSLYVSEDIPRLHQLRDRLGRSRELMRQIRKACRLKPFAFSHPVLELELTPVFANVGPYRRIHRQLLRFLRTGLIILDEGTGERAKSTSRLYEQWVFLQLAAAFRQAGLYCASQNGIVHTSKRFRFTLDLDRGARATFTKDGRAVVLRYEPWVMPHSQAVQNRDSVYRGQTGDAAWSPDILIEFLNVGERAGAPAAIDYAVVVDAKYSRSIKDHHWHGTTKYLEIRSTATGRQVVRQQWLAYPGDSEQAISLRDASVRWTDSGPNCPRDESLQGILAITPATQLHESQMLDGWIQNCEPPVLSFVTSLLSYMDFAVDVSAAERTRTLIQ